MRLILAAAILAATFAMPGRSEAAANHDSCTGYIESLPAYVSTPGTWCLRKNLTTTISSGSAVDISGNDIRLDCGGFRITGLAGAGTTAWGIGSVGTTNVVVRRCSVGGFETGIVVTGSSALVEDNRVDGNDTGITVGEYGMSETTTGIATARRNLVTDSRIEGIQTTGAVAILDNIVDGVSGDPGQDITRSGIYVWAASHSTVSGNIVRNLGQALYGAVGIQVINSGPSTVRDNVVIAMAGATSYDGIYCDRPAQTTRDNQVSGAWSSPVQGCVSHNDDILP